MEIERILEMLNDSQRNVLICFIVQSPLCYTFMYMYSDFFVQQELMNKIIFALSLNIPLISISILGSFLISFITKHDEIDIFMYVFTGTHIYSFSMSVFSKIDNNDITIWYPIITEISCILGMIIVSFYIRFKQQKKQ